MEQPLINILLRTHNRPDLFKRCFDSILQQTYKNINVIIGFQHASDLEYIPWGPVAVRMNTNNLPFFYNTFCNQLKAIVTDGFYFFLDDDDYLDSDTVLEEIAPHLQEDKAVICQFICRGFSQGRRPGMKKPLDELQDAGEIRRGVIGLPCLFLHHSHKNVADLRGELDYDDYNYIKEVTEIVPAKFIKQVVVATDRRSFGRS